MNLGRIYEGRHCVYRFIETGQPYPAGDAAKSSQRGHCFPDMERKIMFFFMPKRYHGQAYCAEKESKQEQFVVGYNVPACK